MFMTPIEKNIKESVEFCKKNYGHVVCPRCEGSGFLLLDPRDSLGNLYTFCDTCEYPRRGILAWTEAIRKGVNIKCGR